MTDSEKKLRDLLARIYWDAQERNTLLANADIPIYKINLNGSPLAIWQSIIEYASNRDMILNLIRAARKDYPEDKQLIQAEQGDFKEHELPSPIISAPTEIAKKSLEALTSGKSTLLPIRFLQKGLICSRSVAKVAREDGGSGTGFLLPENWLITNNHVLPNASIAAGACAQFGFEDGENGVWQTPVIFPFDPSADGFHTSIEDDWTAVRLKGDANSSYGALTFADETMNLNDFVNIIQHPGGAPKRIAIYHNTISAILPRRLQYLTDTLPGSSGSPVFNSHWQVVALHHASTPALDAKTKTYYTCNEGIPSAILRDALLAAKVIGSKPLIRQNIEPGPTINLDTTIIAREEINREVFVPSTSDPGSGVYPVWFGTNRKPVSTTDITKGFTNERNNSITLGRVDVWVPKGHRFGETGNGLLTRLKRFLFRDDHLRIQNIEGRDAKAFWDELKAEMKLAQDQGDAPHALVYLHGYNNSFQDAAIRSAQLGFDLKVPGATAFFSWPSRATLPGYPADEASIEASERAISDFLVNFVAESGAEKVHLVAHSMGNRGLLRAVQRIAADAEKRGKVKFGQVFLAAPDVDRDLFLDLARLYPDFSERTTLYASAGDKAVWGSSIVHEAPRAGYFTPYTVSKGIDTIAVPNFNIDFLGHGYFAEAAPMLNDIQDLMRHNDPPGKRPRLKPKTDGELSFWEMGL